MSFKTRRQREDDKRVRRPHLDVTKAGSELFQRSRTLTGTVSSRISAAVESTSNLSSSRLEVHELRGHRRRLGRWLTLCLLIAVAIVWCLDNLIVSIKPMSNLASTYVPQLESYLNAHPLERIAPLLRHDELARSMQQSSPELADVILDGNEAFARYDMTVVERVPAAKWQLGGKLFYVDKDGVAFERLRVVPVALVTVKDESGLPVEAQQVASRSTMQFIGQVVAQVKSQAVGEVQDIILPAGQLKEIDMTLQNRPYRIKLLVDREPSRQVTDVHNALIYLDKAGVTPKYIDARVEGRAYYSQ